MHKLYPNQHAECFHRPLCPSYSLPTHQRRALRKSWDKLEAGGHTVPTSAKTGKHKAFIIYFVSLKIKARSFHVLIKCFTTELCSQPCDMPITTSFHPKGNSFPRMSSFWSLLSLAQQPANFTPQAIPNPSSLCSTPGTMIPSKVGGNALLSVTTPRHLSS